MQEHRILLPTAEIPHAWYNLSAEIPEGVDAYRHPGTGEALAPDDLRPLFPPALIEQEFSIEKWIAIPDPVREMLSLWRPTPLIRALSLEKHLGTPARIYYKNEAVSPAGSHKPNTAVAQAYYNKIAGITRLATETGAGQWGSSLAFACSLLEGLACKVYMVRVSYEQKPYRRSLMQLWGADVVASPSPDTATGRAALEKDPESSGSLGLAISEAVEDAASHDDTNYTLGSVLNHVVLHQSVIGLETQKQLKLVDETPDVIIGCAGGGSNLAGLVFPFVEQVMAGRGPRLVAVEPSACPTLTRGKYVYDYGDAIGLAPMTRMYSLGHGFMPAGIHAGGLRYHGMSPLVSALRHRGLLEAVAVQQLDAFASAVLFARTEGICPAPEASHAIHAAIAEANRCKDTGEQKCIVFGLSGHGHFDLGSYDRYLKGEIDNFDLPQQTLDTALADLPAQPAEAAT